MLAFLLQLRAWTETGEFFLFALFMLGIWLLWILRVCLAAYYRPVDEPYEVTTSVIIPVVDEPEDLFRSVVGRIIEQRPTEIIVVINGPRNEVLEKICTDLGVRWVWTDIPGKRNALKVGIGMATSDIAVLVDSDTVWSSHTLSELVKPFRDPKVGGVTTRQRILDPGRTVLTRWADWLENVRNEYSMPAMSVLGTVGCLPGRTIAFRRSILVRCMDRFLTERFLGVFLEVSDDRTLTNYTLLSGFRTVYQSTSLVYTDAPTQLKKLAKQQYRWARGSQYNTLRMLPWMLRNTPLLAVFYIADIIVPFVLVGSFVSWGVTLATGANSELYNSLPLPSQPLVAVLSILLLAGLMTTLSLAVRFGRHFAYRPRDMLHLPAFMLINTLMLMPIRVLGFFRMAHNAGWGTRAGGFAGEKERNPQLIVPYVLGSLMLAASVMIGV
ncbi:glycosyltransferase family 2 protein [Micromonospora narathiwatensis]|uniref:Hyaluronan synthase n=1 Tax=Micromonospora narathiwatensis TaxID=299146 RepID=A0A1A8ZIF6_9ACTN|nr:glycosyltransferase family 2 protein [Micromonospora narathiwatensis]SBT43655.1 hyaluronan synthase [Micromonospora narathiwatensis]